MAGSAAANSSKMDMCGEVGWCRSRLYQSQMPLYSQLEGTGSSVDLLKHQNCPPSLADSPQILLRVSLSSSGSNHNVSPGDRAVCEASQKEADPSLSPSAPSSEAYWNLYGSELI
ncbi:hypothetical protein Tco_0796591 [Tanacetum coccineum]